MGGESSSRPSTIAHRVVVVAVADPYDSKMVAGAMITGGACLLALCIVASWCGVLHHVYTMDGSTFSLIDMVWSTAMLFGVHALLMFCTGLSIYQK